MCVFWIRVTEIAYVNPERTVAELIPLFELSRRYDPTTLTCRDLARAPSPQFTV